MKIRILFLFLLSFCCISYAQSVPRLLIKIPTRGNPEQFFNTLDQFYANLSGDFPTHLLITCDHDDESMNNSSILNRLAKYPHLSVLFGDHISKVEAYNRDVNKFLDSFDILLVANDRTSPALYGFDKIIVNQMQNHFPHFDGVINFQSKDSGKNLTTTAVIGKEWYTLFGYIYHPDYVSTPWCKEEQTIVPRMLAREALVIYPLFNSEPSLNSASQGDSFYSAIDKKTYQARFENEFNLDEAFYNRFLSKVWSILICTLDEREDVFSHIYNKLIDQIKANKLEDKIEILWFKDNREYSIGFKRNALMRQSKGFYVNFVDDDDEVSDRYIKMIYTALKKKPDCVSLTGIITFDGNWPCRFVHSLQYRHYFKENDVFYRPPNHLNPMKRSVASRFPFLDISYGEDTDWAMNVCQSNLLKTEVNISTPYYFYKFITQK